jgi:methyl-accepting chemotaxis protein
MKMTIGKKLMGGFLGMAFLMGTISFIAMYELQKVEDAYSDLINRKAVIFADAKDIQTAASRGISGLRGVMLGDESGEQILDESYEEAKEEIASTLRIVQRAETKEQLQELQRLNEEFHLESQKVVDLMKTDEEAARKLADSETIPIARDIRDMADAIDDELQENMADGSKAASDMVNGTQVSILMISIASFVIAAVTGIVITRKIKYPILSIEAVAGRIASGDLTQEDVQVKNRDEIGSLADAFNQMNHDLRGVIQQVGTNADQVSATSEELSVSADQTSKATELISQSMQDMVAGSEAQEASTKMIERDVTDISKGMDQAASSIQKVADLTATANGKVDIGNQVVHRTVKQMNFVQESVQDTAQVVHTMGQKSVEIGQIVDLITQISDQTNLLALNAAIEAARAGEHGKGFAVVADEVRKLAEQSGVAGNEIRRLIQEVQTEASRAVQSMNDGTKVVNQGRDLVMQTGDAFKDISNSIEQVDAESKAVLAIVEKVQTQTESMAARMEGVSRIVEQSASNMQGVAASAEEQTASMEEVASSAEVLSQMAQEMKAAVGRFRV